MSRNEKDYSDYVQHLSTISNSLSVLAGFAFTAITVLLTLLPDPSILLSQVTLFLLVFLLNLLLSLNLWTTRESILHCKNLPKPNRGTGVYNLLILLSSVLLSAVGLFMFLLFNLIYLTLASFVVDALFLILGYLVIWKPFLEYRKKLSSH